MPSWLHRDLEHVWYHGLHLSLCVPGLDFLPALAVFYSDVLALPIFKQEEPQLSPENGARLPPLQYVLCAATSPAVKLHEETLTYLNQGRGVLGVEPGLAPGWRD